MSLGKARGASSVGWVERSEPHLGPSQHRWVSLRSTIHPSVFRGVMGLTECQDALTPRHNNRLWRNSTRLVLAALPALPALQ